MFFLHGILHATSSVALKILYAPVRFWGSCGDGRLRPSRTGRSQLEAGYISSTDGGIPATEQSIHGRPSGNFRSSSRAEGSGRYFDGCSADQTGEIAQQSTRETLRALMV